MFWKVYNCTEVLEFGKERKNNSLCRLIIALFKRNQCWYIKVLRDKALFCRLNKIFISLSHLGTVLVFNASSGLVDNRLQDKPPVLGIVRVIYKR